MALHCPATLLVSRHGDADYTHEHVLSDEGGWLTDLGREQSAALAAGLQDRRVAHVFTSTLGRAVETGAIVAAALGVGTEVLPGLEEFGVGDLAGRPHDDPELGAVFTAWIAGDLAARIPGAESGQEVLDRYRAALRTVADRFRGETALLVSHGGVMSFCLPRMGTNVRDDLAAAKFLPNCAVAEVEVGEQVVVTSWPGSTDRSVV